jgi:hypothetical protein
MMAMLVSVSALAQRKGVTKGSALTVPVTNLCVEDQVGGGYIIFNLQSGEFKCITCEYDIAWSGTGEVKIDGFNVYLSAITPGYYIFVSANVWDKQGKAVVEVFEDPTGAGAIKPFQEYWTDLNMDDNKMTCAPVKQ